ncbi:MAG: hypothetical protein Sapg2KO_00130 [Saprospiraceae bacterium]
MDSLGAYEPMKYEGQSYLDNFETPPILYHYEEKNEKIDQNRGWIIDNKGYLRKYQNVHVRMYDYNNAASMKAFVDRTEVVKQIDLIKLVRLYKKNLKISRESPTVEEMEEINPKTNTYFGYTLSYPDEHGNNCSDLRQVGYYARITLESKGEVLVRNNNSAARAVLDYLKLVSKSEID